MKKTILLLALLVGCAHGKMGEVDAALNKGVITKATPIFVEPIGAEQAAISGDKSGAAETVAKIKATTLSQYNQKIAEALREKGFNAQAVAAGKTSGVVISGEVTKIENGSAAARYFGGFGAGSSNLWTKVKIEDRTAKKILTRFQVIATSGGESGLGSYLDRHLAHGAKQIAEYVEKAQ